MTGLQLQFSGVRNFCFTNSETTIPNCGEHVITRIRVLWFDRTISLMWRWKVKTFAMKSFNTIITMSLSSFGCLTNFATLVYILKSFDIRIHVFTLLLIDAIISIIWSLISVIMDALVLGNIAMVDITYCTISFLSIWLPMFYGAVLTFKVAFLRYFLTIKAAKNVQVNII